MSLNPVRSAESCYKDKVVCQRQGTVKLELNSRKWLDDHPGGGEGGLYYFSPWNIRSTVATWLVVPIHAYALGFLTRITGRAPPHIVGGSIATYGPGKAKALL